MEMKKLHMDTMSFGSTKLSAKLDRFGVDGEPGRSPALNLLMRLL
jgi:hypothetical protein